MPRPAAPAPPPAGRPTRQVALLRGVNVGRSKRIGMADLRALVAGLGFGDVRTLLASGNVVYDALGTPPDEAARRLEAAVAATFAVRARVFVLTAAEVAGAVAEFPLAAVVTNPSLLLVCVPAAASDLARLAPLAAREWGDERIALGTRVAWLWCPQMTHESPLALAAARALGDAGTTRNLATFGKLHALLAGPP